MTLEIGRLTDDDLAAARQLSTQSGWNQTEADWRRLLSLLPETCFAGRVDGNLVATSTLAIHGTKIGWIGMVLVDEAHRRRGYGSAIFERALEAALDRNLEIIGLDATDAGCAVYRQYGFVEVGKIDRWASTLRVRDVNADVTTVREQTEVSEVISFDRRFGGGDRRALLEHLLDSSGVTGLLRRRDGELRGYAIVRPGRTRPQVGPVVALDYGDVEALLSAVAKRVDDAIIDVHRDEKISSVLERYGLDVQRQLRRMTHEEPQRVLDGDAIVAGAGFEWG